MNLKPVYYDSYSCQDTKAPSSTGRRFCALATTAISFQVDIWMNFARVMRVMLPRL
jgi:hypothetical protein